MRCHDLCKPKLEAEKQSHESDKIDLQDQITALEETNEELLSRLADNRQTVCKCATVSALATPRPLSKDEVKSRTDSPHLSPSSDTTSDSKEHKKVMSLQEEFILLDTSDAAETDWSDGSSQRLEGKGILSSRPWWENHPQICQPNLETLLTENPPDNAQEDRHSNLDLGSDLSPLTLGSSDSSVQWSNVFPQEDSAGFDTSDASSLTHQHIVHDHEQSLGNCDDGDLFEQASRSHCGLMSSTMASGHEEGATFMFVTLDDCTKTEQKALDTDWNITYGLNLRPT